MNETLCGGSFKAKTGMDGTQWLPLWDAQSGLARVQRRSYRKRWIELSEDYIPHPASANTRDQGRMWQA